ncbi:MAG: hypothetical protein IJ612_03015 [Prevotella sp.]|nr:hypothetical protein [Prevotella sp.]
MILPVAALLLTASCQESLEDRAEKEASTYTRKNCPVTLSDNIVLDSMTFDRATHTFGYHYTLTGEMDNESAINAEAMKAKLLEGLKNLTSARIYKEEGYSFRYVYRSEADPTKVRLEALFTEADYRQ